MRTYKLKYHPDIESFPYHVIIEYKEWWWIEYEPVPFVNVPGKIIGMSNAISVCCYHNGIGKLFKLKYTPNDLTRLL